MQRVAGRQRALGAPAHPRALGSTGVGQRGGGRCRVDRRPTRHRRTRPTRNVRTHPTRHRRTRPTRNRQTRPARHRRHRDALHPRRRPRARALGHDDTGDDDDGGDQRRRVGVLVEQQGRPRDGQQGLGRAEPGWRARRRRGPGRGTRRRSRGRPRRARHRPARPARRPPGAARCACRARIVTGSDSGSASDEAPGDHLPARHRARQAPALGVAERGGDEGEQQQHVAALRAAGAARQRVGHDGGAAGQAGQPEQRAGTLPSANDGDDRGGHRKQAGHHGGVGGGRVTQGDRARAGRSRCRSRRRPTARAGSWSREGSGARSASRVSAAARAPMTERPAPTTVWIEAAQRERGRRERSREGKHAERRPPQRRERYPPSRQ